MSPGAALSAVSRGKALLDGAASHRSQAIGVLDRTKEPGFAGRAALSRTSLLPSAEAYSPEVSGRAAAVEWRTIRAFIEGIHPGDGERRV